MRVLAGDIGGTTARLAICEVDGTTVRRDIQAVYTSQSHDSLEDIARTFIASNSVEVHVACFGVPGPVSGRRAQTTNLPWRLDADELERNLGIKSVHLINDLEASAHGLITLAPADFLELRAGASGAVGNQGLIAAGTGLGEAGLRWDGRRHRAFASEGGHTDFAPSNAREDQLLAWLRAKLEGHVSWERVVSGPGLVNLFEFLQAQSPSDASKRVDEAIAAGEDGAEAIVRGATRDGDPRCVEALDWFMALYGAEAGNVALKYLATGGMFVAGGIAPKIAKALKGSRFVERFDDKGRLRSLLETVPIRVVTNNSIALQGAAHLAARRARGKNH
ncbi:MAG: glucokinase [Nannocystaceae bacterium]|nr:glucokinase [Nannocystaceae bacterium]